MNYIINGKFLTQKITGVQRFAWEIIKELDHISCDGRFLIAAPPELTDLPSFKNIKVIKTGRLHKNCWEQISLPLFAKNQKRIILNLCNSAPLISPGVVCIHDVKIKAHPEYFSKQFKVWYSILFRNETKRAKIVVTVSEFSKKEILRYYSISADQVWVVPDAWQHFERVSYDEDTLEKYQIKHGEYYFSMCSLEPNKNFKWVAEIAKRNPKYTFAVAGSVNKNVFADGIGFECPANMRFLGFVSDGEAKTLMRDCKAFLFPTYYEGFGMPPLEAMSAGAKSIVVSDTEIMHELFGDCVNYINPDDYNCNINQLKEITPEQGKEILSRYSWEKSARELLTVLEQL